MSYYPIFFDLKDRLALVVGGGKVAQRKVNTLLSYGARVNIVSETLTVRLRELTEKGDIHYLGDKFDPAYLEGVSLVFAATDNKNLNHQISKIVRARGILVNAVDQPEDCSFIVPAIVRRGDLSVAISTSGKSPALSRMLREKLDAQFGEEYEIFLVLMGMLRKKILSQGYEQSENSAIFTEIVRSDIINALKKRDMGKVKKILQEILPSEISAESMLMELGIL